MFGPGATKYLHILRFYYATDDQVFPMNVINKMINLEKELCRLGITCAMICGERMEVGYGSRKFTIPAHELSSFGGTHMGFAQYSDKTHVIATLAFAIMLLNIGYIKDLELISSKEVEDNAEAEELWQTAWSILINMKEV